MSIIERAGAQLIENRKPDRIVEPESASTGHSTSHSASNTLRIILQPTGDSTLEPIVITDGEFTIGRKLEPFNSESDVLKVSGLSRQHARICEEDGHAYITDLGSLNGTFLNNLQLGHERAKLATGDDLDFGGKYLFTVVVDQQPTGDLTIMEVHSPVELCLIPQEDGDLETLVVTRFPFLISRNDETFQAVKRQHPDEIKQLSRQHALITLEGEQLFIEDLGSANGTLLGDTRVTKEACAINDGDRIRFGDGMFNYGVQIRLLDDDRTIYSIGNEPSGPAAGSNYPVSLASNPTCELDLVALAETGAIVPGHSQHARAQEFRRIKRKLLQNLHTDEEQTDAVPKNLILVTSSVSGEGKTFVSTNLALSLAEEMDHRVLLVDGDPAKSDLSDIMGMDSHEGYVNMLLAGKSNVDSCILRTNIERLHLLPNGMSVDNLDELFASHLMKEMLFALARQDPNRIIIFDGPPLIQATEAGVLARSMGQTILVVEASTTPQQTVAAAAEQLATCQCVSAVLNKAPRPFALSA